MIDVVVQLPSTFNTIPSEKEIIKMVRKIGEELSEKCENELRKNGIYCVGQVENMTKDMFLDIYVNRGMHGQSSAFDLYNFVRNEMTEVHQVLQQLAYVYVNARTLSLGG